MAATRRSKKLPATDDPHVAVMLVVRGSARKRWLKQAEVGGQTITEWAEAVLDRACLHPHRFCDLCGENVD